MLEVLGGYVDARWLALAAMSASLLLLLALVVVSMRYSRLRHLLEVGGVLGLEAAARVSAQEAQSELETGSRALVDRILPRSAPLFLMLVLGLAAGVWGLGYALAPDRGRFLGSTEWQFQPFYLAAHLVTLRLFITVFTRNFAAGVAHLDMPPERALDGFRIILGPIGALAAVAIALPFCIGDWGYLNSARYERMGEVVGAVDYLMWGIWCFEWLLNAFIWVVLAGFLVMNVWAIRAYNFRSPIEVVLDQKHYRPFLQMSSQGATIVLGFAILTAGYIWYTGGGETDYLGLVVAALLLVAGFLPPWMLLNAKIDRAVRDQASILRRDLAGGARLHATDVVHEEAQPLVRTLEERLDEALAMLRIQHLERLRGGVGRTEMTAVAVRLAAPAATVAWQMAQNFYELVAKGGAMLKAILAWVLRLFM